MPETKAGGIKVRETLYAKYGEDYFRNIGGAGGIKSNPLKGFGSNRELASKMGKATKRGVQRAKA